MTAIIFEHFQCTGRSTNTAHQLYPSILLAVLEEAGAVQWSAQEDAADVRAQSAVTRTGTLCGERIL